MRRSAAADSSDQRRADAELILASAAAAATWEKATGHIAPVKPLRELIWFVWEQPRLDRPLYRSKYPLSALWTPGARVLYEQGVAGVSIEHVLPAAVLVRRLIEDPPANAAALIRILNQTTYVVIAPEDNRLLMDARVASKLAPDSTDPWDRYRVAGLDPATFAPIKPAG